MTLDALLSILLAVVVPGLMALIGGVLAARALPSEPGKKNPEMWYWVGGFVFLFLISLVLAFVQQVRNTAQQQAANQKATQAELRSTGEIKYMQGQLDSINKVLSTLSSNSNPQQTIGILKSLMLQPSKDVDIICQKLEACPSPELRKRALLLANRLDDLYLQFDKAAREEVDAVHKPAHEALIRGKRAMMSSRYRSDYEPEVLEYRKVIISRLPPGSVDHSQDSLFDNQGPGWASFSIIENVNNIAGDLRQLASQLPEH